MPEASVVINPGPSRPRDPLAFLAKALGPRAGLAGKEPAHKGQEWQGPADVQAARRTLLRQAVASEPMNVILDGTFIPCVLMMSGWWERAPKGEASRVIWRSPVQGWLFHGFEQWAPSWDISTRLEASSQEGPALSRAEGFLLGQLGHGDEADSLFVIVPKEKAADVREALSAMNGAMGVQVRVRGQLCHRDHLPKDEQAAARRWGKAFDYFIRLDRANPGHDIRPAGARPDVYSGYLWQCLVPKAWWADQAKPPRLEDTFLAWEHTDFTRPDAVKYNLDSLARKAAYLEREFGSLALVQKSSALVPGNPVYSVDQFYSYVLTSGTVVNPARG